MPSIFFNRYEKIIAKTIPIAEENSKNNSACCANAENSTFSIHNETIAIMTKISIIADSTWTKASPFFENLYADRMLFITEPSMTHIKNPTVAASFRS